MTKQLETIFYINFVGISDFNNRLDLENSASEKKMKK